MNNLYGFAEISNCVIREWANVSYCVILRLGTRTQEILNNEFYNITSKVIGTVDYTGHIINGTINIINNLIYNCSSHCIKLGTSSSDTTYGSSTDINITNNTLVGNYSTTSFGGIYAGRIGFDSGGTINVKNNIVANWYVGLWAYKCDSTFTTYSDRSYNCYDGNYLDVGITGTYAWGSDGGTDFTIDPLFYSATPSSLNDFRLKSTAGRWDGSTWPTDAVDSPCIDTGDPGDTYSLEPSPNGGRINVGFDGNTIYASKSTSGSETVEEEEEITISDELTEISETPLVKEISEEVSLTDEYTFYNVDEEDTVTVSDELTEIYETTVVEEVGEDLYLADEYTFYNVDEDEEVVLTDEADVSIISNIYGNISSYLNTVSVFEEDIANKFNSVYYETKNLVSYFSMAYYQISNVISDIRTKIESFSNIKNDFRMLLPWQKIGPAGPQSRGKEYIKVYIDSIEQTDTNVDSISIEKMLDSFHICSFELARAFDSVDIPLVESTVQVKYDSYVLYSGYIINIEEGDLPDTIRVQCKDKFWKNNRESVYFYVGNKTDETVSTYYDKINQGLSSLSLNFDIGNFTPDLIDCYGMSQSNAITSLVNTSGNFSWYYDVNGTAQLWTAGSGRIINLEQQQVGVNLNLYQILNFKEENFIDNIVNRYKVQIGEQVLKQATVSTINSTSNITSYYTFTYQTYETIYLSVTPEENWDTQYEVYSRNTGMFGFDNPERGTEYLYNDVYTRYKLPGLEIFQNAAGDLDRLQNENWSDIYPPQVGVRAEYFTDSSQMVGMPTDPASIENPQDGGWNWLNKGFTINYEKSELTFSKRLYIMNTSWLWEEDAGGTTITTIDTITSRAPQLIVRLWKKRFYDINYNRMIEETEEGGGTSENPDEDITNPLMFYISMGDYPITITENKFYTGYGKQTGGTSNTNEIRNIIPSYDDVPYVTDLASWELSKICDEKKTIDIELTLDAACLYNIQLKDRLFSELWSSNLNIHSISYNISNFTVKIALVNDRAYSRTVSLQKRIPDSNIS